MNFEEDEEPSPAERMPSLLFACCQSFDGDDSENDHDAEDEMHPASVADGTSPSNRCNTADGDDPSHRQTKKPEEETTTEHAKPTTTNTTHHHHKLQTQLEMNAASQIAHAQDWPAFFALLQQRPHLVNCTNSDSRRKYTPLHIAAYYGTVDIVKELLCCWGADPMRLSTDNRTPLTLAKERHPNNVELHQAFLSMPDCGCSISTTPTTTATVPLFPYRQPTISQLIRREVSSTTPALLSSLLAGNDHAVVDGGANKMGMVFHNILIRFSSVEVAGPPIDVYSVIHSIGLAVLSLLADQDYQKNTQRQKSENLLVQEERGVDSVKLEQSDTTDDVLGSSNPALSAFTAIQSQLPVPWRSFLKQLAERLSHSLSYAITAPSLVMASDLLHGFIFQCPGDGADGRADCGRDQRSSHGKVATNDHGKQLTTVHPLWLQRLHSLLATVPVQEAAFIQKKEGNGGLQVMWDVLDPLLLGASDAVVMPSTALSSVSLAATRTTAAPAISKKVQLEWCRQLRRHIDAELVRLQQRTLFFNRCKESLLSSRAKTEPQKGTREENGDNDDDEIVEPQQHGKTQGKKTVTAATSDELCWYAFGDWGEVVDGTKPVPALLVLAEAMAHYAEKQCPPNFILLLGDNFYPCGVSSVRDPRFKTQWADVFLKHSLLQVPYKVVMGNHDLRSEGGIAQIEFTSSKLNPGGLWQMQGDDASTPPCNHYHFARPIPKKRTSSSSSHVALSNFSAGFWVIDTNDAQPVPKGDAIKKRQSKFMKECGYWLAKSMSGSMIEEQQAAAKKGRQESSSAATTRKTSPLPSVYCWRFVVGHHPMYTKGAGHGPEGVFLREGLGLEAMVKEGGCDCYLSGHDHVMQHVAVKGIDHVVAGGAIESHFWRGEDAKIQMDFAKRGVVGFTVFRISVTEKETTLTVQIIDARTKEAVYQFKRTKPLI